MRFNVEPGKVESPASFKKKKKTVFVLGSLQLQDLRIDLGRILFYC